MAAKKKTRSKVIMFAEIILIVIFLIAVFEIGKILYSYRQGDSFYDNSVSTYVSETSDTTSRNSELGIAVDITALQEVNPDVVGWIVIPETNVNYPLLFADSDQKYLRTTYTGEYSVFGSIFISKDCSGDLTDTHTVIYGHNTKNGSMFGSLKNYKDADYKNQHPYVYIVRDDYTFKYEIFSAFTVDTSDDVYTLTFDTPESYSSWQTDIIGRSDFPADASYVPDGTEHIITLSTCTSRTKTERYVVNARLVDYWESA